MASVRLVDVTKIFRGRDQDVQAVYELNLDIRDGEFLVLVGPSGCGKSTTLRMIAGLEFPTMGTIFIGDEDVTRYRPRDRNTAMVFQDYALYPHMTVRQNMAFALQNLKFPRNVINERVERAAKMIGLENLLDRRPRELSGGQRQRVALGRAIVREPHVFLFDEPLSNLDAKLRTHMRVELLKLHQELGITMIYVTHDQIEAMTLGDRIAVMHEGKLQQVDTPSKIYRQPANLFVAGFIGSPPMNFLPATLVHESGATYLQIGKQRIGANLTVEAPISEVIVGIRPERIEVHPCAPNPRMPQNGRAVLRGEVTVVEGLGAESILHISIGEHSLLARHFEDTTFASGENVEIEFSLDSIHLFDPSTEVRLAHTVHQEEAAS